MTWVVVGLGVAIGLVVAAMFLLAGVRRPAAPAAPDERCRILVRPAAPDPDLWMPEEWL